METNQPTVAYPPNFSPLAFAIFLEAIAHENYNIANEKAIGALAFYDKKCMVRNEWRKTVKTIFGFVANMPERVFDTANADLLAKEVFLTSVPKSYLKITNYDNLSLFYKDRWRKLISFTLPKIIFLWNK